MPFPYQIDLSTFEEVPEPQARDDVYRLAVSGSDQISQNSAFHRKLDGADTFRLRISPDGRMLALSPEEPHNLTFTPAGVRTHHPLGDMLRQRGLELPLSFRMRWDAALNCWIGQYEGLTPPPVQKRKDKSPAPHHGRGGAL